MPDNKFLTKCPVCGSQVAKSAKICPSCGTVRNKSQSLKIALIVTAAVIVLFALISPEEQSDDNLTSSAKSSGGRVVPAYDIPAAQDEFIKTVSLYSEKFSSTDNEIQQSMLRDQRKIDLASLHIANRVRGWIGTIDDIGTTSQGKAYIRVRIAPNIRIETWNNELSDVMDNTLINKSSDAYRTLSTMKKGDRIKFGGSFLKSDMDFYKETSITIAGSMRDPEFLFKFSYVEPLE